MTQAGPWHARVLREGQAAMDALAVQFFKQYPRDKPLEHTPAARLLVLQKTMQSSL